MTQIPHCDDLFLRFFDPQYDEDDRERKGYEATRPDLLTDAGYKGSSAATASNLTEEWQDKVLEQINRMTQAASTDCAPYLGLSGELDVAWIEAFDAYYDLDRISEVIERSDPEDFSNDYVILCCEFGAAIGHVMKSLLPRLFWNPAWPYWESSLVDPASGSVIPVFHWAIKKMSDYGWDDGFAEKIEACLQMLDQPSNITIP